MQQNSISHFQRNLTKHIRKSHREDFCKELKDVFNPDEVFYTTEQGIENLKTVLRKWTKTYPKLQSTVDRDDLDTDFKGRLSI